MSAVIVEGVYDIVKLVHDRFHLLNSSSICASANMCGLMASNVSNVNHSPVQADCLVTLMQICSCPGFRFGEARHPGNLQPLAIQPFRPLCSPWVMSTHVLFFGSGYSRMFSAPSRFAFKPFRRVIGSHLPFREPPAARAHIKSTAFLKRHLLFLCALLIPCAHTPFMAPASYAIFDRLNPRREAEIDIQHPHYPACQVSTRDAVHQHSPAGAYFERRAIVRIVPPVQVEYSFYAQTR